MKNINNLSKQQKQRPGQKVGTGLREQERGREADLQKIGADAKWKRRTEYPSMKDAGNQSAAKFPPPLASRIAATFEASRIVVAWALGREFRVAGIKKTVNLDGKLVPCSYIAFDAGPAKKAGIGAMNYLTACALSYAGAVNYARKSHVAFERVLATHGSQDRDRNERLFSDLPTGFDREEIESIALFIARAICTKYMVLLNAVEAILLANNEIKWSEFSELLEANGLPVAGDDFYAGW
jgi:hypothetical protein